MIWSWPGGLLVSLLWIVFSLNPSFAEKMSSDTSTSEFTAGGEMVLPGGQIILTFSTPPLPEGRAYKLTTHFNFSFIDSASSNGTTSTLDAGRAMLIKVGVNKRKDAFDCGEYLVKPNRTSFVCWLLDVSKYYKEETPSFEVRYWSPRVKGSPLTVLVNSTLQSIAEMGSRGPVLRQAALPVPLFKVKDLPGTSSDVSFEFSKTEFPPLSTVRLFLSLEVAIIGADHSLDIMPTEFSLAFPKTRKMYCSVPSNQTSDRQLCLNSVEVSGIMFSNRSKSLLTVSVKRATRKQMISLRVTIESVPFALRRWLHTGISGDMISCLLSEFSKIRYPRPVGILDISKGGKQVSVRYWSAVSSASEDKSDGSSLPYRMADMEYGIRQAIWYAQDNMNVKSFPDLHAILWVGDEPHLVPVENVSTACPGVSAWPPIISQNIDLSVNNLFVHAPDFSFFSTFSQKHDHGGPTDIWFHAMKNSVYGRTPFEAKSDSAVFRGTILGRRYGWLRESLLRSSCSSHSELDVSKTNYLSKEAMCRGHKSIISIPGNGAWSWSTKFNLLCNSVTIMVNPLAIDGFSWETRTSMGLKPGYHYLELPVDASASCRTVVEYVQWIKNNPIEAKAMAGRARKLVLEKLSKSAVLRDMALILLDYAALNTSSYNPNKRLAMLKA